MSMRGSPAGRYGKGKERGRVRFAAERNRPERRAPLRAVPIPA